MTRFPLRTNQSEVGSNLANYKSLREQQTREIEVRHSAYDKAQSAFSRQRAKILTDEVVKKIAVPIFEKNRRSFERSFLKANGDVDKIAEAKAETRKSINRALLKSIPKYKQYRALQKAFSKKHSSLSKAEFRPRIKNKLGIHLGKVVIGDTGWHQIDFKDFTAPYALHDVYTHEAGVDELDNRSYVEPQSGVLAHNFSFFHKESDWGGYHPAAVAYLHSSLGINYQVPESGHLKCSAVVQCIYNNIACSVTDLEGFSSSNMSNKLSLFFAIIRSRERTQIDKIMIEFEINSDGDDISFIAPQIPTTTPFTLSFSPTDAFQQGENIQVLVGSSFQITSDLDDMKSNVDALVAWRLQEISLGIQTDVVVGPTS
jgi:hypothetical protein